YGGPLAVRHLGDTDLAVGIAEVGGVGVGELPQRDRAGIGFTEACRIGYVESIDALAAAAEAADEDRAPGAGAVVVRQPGIDDGRRFVDIMRVHVGRLGQVGQVREHFVRHIGNFFLAV